MRFMKGLHNMSTLLSDFKDDEVLIINGHEVLVKFLKYQIEYVCGKKVPPEKVEVNKDYVRILE